MDFDFRTWLRQIYPGNARQGHAGAGYAASFEVLRDDAFLPEQERQLLELSRHWDGYVREAAVRKLRHAQSPEALRAIIGRLNDWVPQVRTAAVAAAEAFIGCNGVMGILPCLAEVIALSGKQRANHLPFIASIDQLLGGAETRDAVRAFCKASHGAVARYFFAQMLAWQGVDLNVTLNVGIRHRDLTVRMAALRACAPLDGAMALPFLHELLGDKQPSIRKEALRMSWVKADDATVKTALLRRFLVDRGISVRELAWWHAQQAEFDLDGYLQQAIRGFPRNDATDAGAIGLIGMLGARQHLALVRQAFAGRCPTVRRAALTAWVQLDSKDAVEAVVQAVLETGKLSATARRLISKGAVDLPEERQHQIVAAALEHQHVDKALAFIKRMPVWDRFECLLSCLAHAPGDENAAKINRALREWEAAQSQCCVKLGGGQRLRLLALLGKANILENLLAMPRMTFALAQVGLWDKT